MRTPRLLLAAPHSGAGKTTVALALLLRLRELGFRCTILQQENRQAF
ncbi:hypothetical protein [Meiothermus sp. QL-1]|nr:hypothetical protein [Meiothermus sp. QL-1]